MQRKTRPKNIGKNRKANKFERGRKRYLPRLGFGFMFLITISFAISCEPPKTVHGEDYSIIRYDDNGVPIDE